MYREVTMIELREVLRLRAEGLPKKRIAAQLGLDPKTVRRYLEVATTAGVPATGRAITDEQVRAVLLALHPAGGRPRGDGWARCVAQRAAIERWLGERLRLTKIRKLLGRQGVHIAYPTLHRFAVLELQFGKTATTIPVLDGEPGHELQVDTGWVGYLTLPHGKRRRFRAWIFTAVRSRHRFVYPTFEETTARAIEACEAAWEFFGGVFKVLIPDNTKAIITAADPLAPRITPAFLEYAQARHFHIDAARVRHARDKGRVERAVPGVRDDCFRRRSPHYARRRAHARPTLVSGGVWATAPQSDAAAPARALSRRGAGGPAAGAEHALRHSAVGRAQSRARSARHCRQSALLDSAPVCRSAAHGARRCADRPLLCPRAADQNACAASPRRALHRPE